MHIPGFKLFVGAVLALVMTGCGGAPPPVSLAPAPEFKTSDTGQGGSVALRVIDARKDTALGNRDPAFGDPQAIRSEQDVGAVLRDQVTAGLNAQGFEVTDYAKSAERRLTVRLETFAYQTSSAVVTSKVRVRSAIAVAAHGPNRTFERRFATESSDRVAFSPGEESRAEAVNAALTALIEQIFAEPALLDVLAGS